MRVLHVYQDFHPRRGGIEDFLLELATQMSATTEQIVLTANTSPSTHVETVRGVRVIRAGSFGRYYTPFCPTWPLWIRRTAPDVVHIHLPCPMAELAALVARPRRLIVSLHNDYVKPKGFVGAWGPFHRATLARATRIVVSSAEYGATSLPLRALGRQPDGTGGRTVAIPYGVSPSDPASRPPATDQLRRRYAPPLVVFLGRLCYYKGLEVLIEAARSVAATCLIIGDGPLRRELESQAAGTENVHFLGALPEDEAIAHLFAADVFVLPSTYRSEAFGIAQLKAMACGVPVVTTDLPGIAWVNRHGETGLTVPPNDPHALATALNSLLSDGALRERLAIGARRRARELSLDRMLAAYAALYQDCLAGTASALPGLPERVS